VRYAAQVQKQHQAGTALLRDVLHFCNIYNQLLLLLLLLVQELPASARWVSEAIFTALLLSFIAWTFTPLLAQRSFSTAVLWTRLLTALVGENGSERCRRNHTAYSSNCKHTWMH
jgi:hypothetical protein